MSFCNGLFGKLEYRDRGLWINLVLWVALLITVAATFVPFFPEMPAAYLDPSWKFGMAQAVAQGISFGGGVIFTFGPYASVYTKSYHPSTDFMMVSAGVYLALSYWACLVFLMRGVHWCWILASCAVLAGLRLMYLPDPLFFSLPLLIGLLTFKIISSEEGTLAKGGMAPVCVVLLFMPFGLLPLVKGSISILCGATVALCALFFLASGRRIFAAICLFSPLVSMLLFWVASGQSAVSLPFYFISMIPIVSGYTEAMAMDGNFGEIVLYIVAATFLLLAIATKRGLNGGSKAFLFLIYFVFLFIAFKAGFVRHDSHAVISGTAILISALFLLFVISNRISLLAVLFSFLAWSYIDGNYIGTSPQLIFDNTRLTYSKLWFGIKSRMEDGGWPKSEFEATTKFLREQASFPVLEGTTDIYSFNQSYLISSGNVWSPRPIIQSYSAYTPVLAEINRNHLLGNRAPDNVIFRVEPIDGRVPSIEDGVSWPILLSKYRPTRIENDFLFLQKRGGIDDAREQVMPGSEMHAFGESVILPKSNKLLFVKIEIKPTILGRVANILFKPSQLQVTFELESGVKKKYRLIAGMAKSGFLISPLIESTTEFGMLYGGSGFLNKKLVKSMVIAPHNDGDPLWDARYNVTFSQVDVPPPIDISKIYGLDGFDAEISGSSAVAERKCEGSIDVINDAFPAPATFSAAGLLKVGGWLAASVEDAVLPEAVYVVLTDDKGSRKYFRAHVNNRRDVGAFFKKPELNKSGYNVAADISMLEGKYILGLAMKTAGKIELCQQFKIPAVILN